MDFSGRECLAWYMAGQRLSRKQLRSLRVEALRMFEAGIDPEVIQVALGAGRSTVYKWFAIYRMVAGRMRC